MAGKKVKEMPILAQGMQTVQAAERIYNKLQGQPLRGGSEIPTCSSSACFAQKNRWKSMVLVLYSFHTCSAVLLCEPGL